MHVVLLQQLESEEKVVNVVEDQRTTLAVCFFRLEEVHWLLAPMPSGVEVVGCVVAVVEAESIALVKKG